MTAGDQPVGGGPGNHGRQGHTAEGDQHDNRHPIHRQVPALDEISRHPRHAEIQKIVVAERAQNDADNGAAAEDPHQLSRSL